LKEEEGENYGGACVWSLKFEVWRDESGKRTWREPGGEESRWSSSSSMIRRAISLLKSAKNRSSSSSTATSMSVWSEWEPKKAS